MALGTNAVATAQMLKAEAITSSGAAKTMLALLQEQIRIVGLSQEPLPHLIQTVIQDTIREVFSDV